MNHIRCIKNKFLSSWILPLFPENYQEMDFIEPYGPSMVLLNKINPDSGRIEVLNDLDIGVSMIFKALRDDPSMFIGRLKRIKYCENTFEKALKSIGGDELDIAVNEFVLRQMSRGGLKKSFKPTTEEDSWILAIEQLLIVAARVKNVFIFNKLPLTVIQAFDDVNVLVYVSPPEISNDGEMAAGDHAKLAEYLQQFRGKVIVSAYQNAFYKRHYLEEDGWRFVKKKTTQGIQQLLMNY